MVGDAIPGLVILDYIRKQSRAPSSCEESCRLPEVQRALFAGPWPEWKPIHRSLGNNGILVKMMAAFTPRKRKCHSLNADNGDSLLTDISWSKLNLRITENLSIT